MPFAPFQHDVSLEEYLVPAEAFLQKHSEYDVLVTGIAVFGGDKLLLVQRAADEKAFPNFWEIPGGKVDDADETILHAAVRELKEETGLDAVKLTRRVGQFTFDSDRKKNGKTRWLKLIFEVEVKDMAEMKLDPVEHQKWLLASEDEVANGKIGDVTLAYISADNKDIKLDAFRLHRESRSKSSI